MKQAEVMNTNGITSRRSRGINPGRMKAQSW